MSGHLVKKAYLKTKYTSAQVKILRQCSQDPIFFIEHFCKLIDGKTGKEILFKLFPYQLELIESVRDCKNTIALFGRQMGKTETLVSYMIWYAMFKPNQNVLIAAHKFEHVSEIMKRLKQVYEGLPHWLKAGVLKDGYNARSIKFDNGSVIQGVATSGNAGRGKAINLLYVDEMAFISPGIAKEFWASIQPTLAATRGKCVITSTPSSDDDEFAQIWHGAINTTDEFGNTIPNDLGRNGFRGIFAKWNQRPDRDESFKEEQLAAIGEERWRREHECEFISFDETLINPIFLNEEISKGLMEPVYTTGTVRWYAPVKANKTYVVALDPSIGSGGDPAAIQIFQMPEFTQVGEWRHNKTPIPGQIRILMGILQFIYNEMGSQAEQMQEPDVYWTVENNTIGEAALIVINETGEDNFPGTMLTESKRNRNSKAYRRGFNTTNKKKVEACSRLKSLIESRKITIHSKALIRELKFFVAKGVGYEAKMGETDDLVMATLLVIRMVQELVQWDDSIMESVSEGISDFDGEILEPMPTLIL